MLDEVSCLAAADAEAGARDSVQPQRRLHRAHLLRFGLPHAQLRQVYLLRRHRHPPHLHMYMIISLLWGQAKHKVIPAPGDDRKEEDDLTYECTQHTRVSLIAQTAPHLPKELK